MNLAHCMQQVSHMCVLKVSCVALQMREVLLEIELLERDALLTDVSRHQCFLTWPSCDI